MNPSCPDIPGYAVECELGRGGMGVVYRARRESTGQRLALKVILIDGREVGFQELARFRIEAEAMACLNHPNIIKVRDIGLVCGHPFLAIDLAPGGSLRDRLSGRPLSPRWSAGLARTLALALGHAHGRGMLHRDLKPANVLFMEEDVPVLSDFGLVKFAVPLGKVHDACCTIDMSSMLDELLASQFAAELRAQYAPISGPDGPEDSVLDELWRQCDTRTGLLPPREARRAAVRLFLDVARRGRTRPGRPEPILDDLTRSGSLMGSPTYMAPEQAAGDLDRVGPQTDLHALGAILYVLLTGRPPFQAPRLDALLQQVKSAVPVPPHQLVAEIPEEIEAICLRCLEKAPERRFRDAHSLAEALSNFLGRAASSGEVPARRTSIPERSAGSSPPPKTRAGTSTTLDQPGESKRRWWPFRRS
ncbi:serine/threonine-protein kinase [Aquisphaera insulae]|uniref:serine/threonine-protein kinase n=1 Tax=Aquisphaera insulae TaxID=2712864 RepID=UPI0013ED21D6|nr:serine/threonine-protein kinase [Aquisphaera insulae]